jgi:hypothetical protein
MFCQASFATLALVHLRERHRCRVSPPPGGVEFSRQLGKYPNPRMSDGKTPLQAIRSNQTSIHYQRRYPVLHNSAAAYVVAIVWLLVIVVGMGRALLKG